MPHCTFRTEHESFACKKHRCHWSHLNQMASGFGRRIGLPLRQIQHLEQVVVQSSEGDFLCCRYLAHDLPREFKQIRLWIGASLIQSPSIYCHGVQCPREKRPPPFLRPDLDAIASDHLVEEVHASHVLVVDGEWSWNFQWFACSPLMTISRKFKF